MLYLLSETIQKRLAVVLVLFVLASSGAAYYFYRQYADIRQNPQKVAQEEVRRLVQRVGELIVLPEGEEPTVATVTDPERLKTQPFFVKAKKGDKVLIYTNARKAILYDPVSNKIIEVAPVSIGAPTTLAPPPAPEEIAPAGE